MARMRRKGDLPQKLCRNCGLPFAWRKKWAKDWENVQYCSDRCRRERPKAGADRKQVADRKQTV